jgi:ribosome-associated GTPase EngA
MRKEVSRPKVALIGRPNVGKSTLFNRLIGRRQAITDELPGVTRDRLYGVCEWDGYELTVIDCGGLGEESEDPLWRSVADNTRRALDEADAVIFVGDARTGMTVSDDEVLKELRGRKKLVVVAVNKVESQNHELLAYEFYKLGYKDIIFISSLAGYNVGDMLDLLIKQLDWAQWPEAVPEYMKWRYGEGPHPLGLPDEPRRRLRSEQVAARLADSAEAGEEDAEQEYADADDSNDDEYEDDGEFAEDEEFADEEFGDSELDEEVLGDDDLGDDDFEDDFEDEGEAEEETEDGAGGAVDPDDLDELGGLEDELGADYNFAWSAEPGRQRPRFIPDESWRDEPVQLVFVGRQNAGKSSLTNALLQESRALVSDLAGTTRDPLWAEFEWEGKRYELLDTAGMKRISRLKQDVDYYSLIRAEKSLSTSEVALLTIDTQLGVTEQDKRVASKIAERGRGIVVVVNKADLLPPGAAAQEMYQEYVRRQLGKLRWAEIIFTSATERTGLDALLKAVNHARESFHRQIENKSLRMVLKEAITLNPPPVVKNRELRFTDFKQIANCPPVILLEVNDKLIIRQAYRRFVENSIRKHFDLKGTHITLLFYVRKRKTSARKRK